MSGFDQFDRALPTIVQPTPVTTNEAHVKLRRNLDKALEVHHQAMDGMLPQETEGSKRLALEAATATVKAALTTDRTALKARSENALEKVLMRVVFYRLLHGESVRPEDGEKLKSAPRRSLEDWLSPRELKQYDRLEW